MKIKKPWIVVRGGGDLASGTIHKLARCGYSVLVLEIENPSAIRRNVAFSEAVYEGSCQIEGITARLAVTLEEAQQMMKNREIPVMVDPYGEILKEIQPEVLIDAILAKRNLGTNREMSPITIALGPGFVAGMDVDAVIETKRGHHLGRVILDGSAEPNTGVPGMIGGYAKERVIHSPEEGILRNVKHITNTVKKGEIIALVETRDGTVEVPATIDGLLRGLIRDGYPVTKGFKIADIDPRMEEYENCFTISDKARCIAGGALEAMLYLQSEQRKQEIEWSSQ